MEVSEIKSEAVSPPPASPAAGKFDIVDKWRARVLFRTPANPAGSGCSSGDTSTVSPIGTSWTKMIERKMAVLKVALPFLTERQLLGKAWQECGFKSIMGGVPRSGLPPKIKKEFTKRGHSRFSQKPRIKKEPKTEECPYSFLDPKPEPSQSQASDQDFNASFDTEIQTITNNAQTLDLFQVSEGNEAGAVSPILNTRKKLKKAHFRNKTNQLNQTQSSYILPCSLNTTEPKLYFDHTKNVALVPSTSNEKISSQCIISNEYPTTQEVSNKTSSSQDSEVQSNVHKVFPEQLQNSLMPSDMWVINYNELQKCMNLDAKHMIIEINKPPLQSQTPSMIENTNEKFINEESIGTDSSCSYAETTPLQSTKVNAKKRIVFETVAEVYHSDTDVVERTEVIEKTPEHQIIRPSSRVPNYNGYSVASCDVDKIEYAEEYLEKKDENEMQNICVTPVQHINAAHFNAIEPNVVHLSCEKMDEEPITSGNNDGIDKGQFKVQGHSEFYRDTRVNGKNGLVYKSHQLNHDYKSSQLDYDTLSISLPLTPVDLSEYTKLPPECLLSNCCSEQDASCTNLNIRPIEKRNYYSDKVINYLKDHFDSIIPPDRSMKDFLLAPEKSFKKVVAVVQRKIVHIMSVLDEEYGF